MDREQEELQFLGLFGIFKESYKIIVSWRKIFAQITLTLILPLTFIFLAHIEISHSLFKDIKHTEFEKEITRPGTKRYNNLSDTLSSEWITFWLFKVAYFTVLLILSLLSTAAVVYTIASIYTGRELTFKKVMSVVPKVWKRLMVTFLCMFAAFFVYNFFAASIIVICFVILPNSVVSAIILYVVLIVYLMGFVYMTVIWQLASVVSVLESSYGIKAMTKSMDLIKGNRVVAVAIFFLLNLSLGLIQFLFSLMVVHGSSYQAWKRVGFGVLCFVLLLALFLFGLVIQTILYLVCKSYHHENIDKGDLSNHLESYLGEYEPLNGKEVQLEQYDV
ncbi:hypothetical protein HanRHA438_Chr08g0361801 [Helianthus annuus]|nr:uncharacterized protein LOC110913937 [Helianthus annuus]KAJ0547875.1 hypothetical protein HanIR_Chr08g0377101 [Helianthus annuus]KAJ0554354.1 hypothetical protein HanHA89_Chr08g0306801 [Helianthus annuus]KAJ0719947.1 hypothetical protein HanLR1_Chr08g0287491 [Helianthus annuus]KAJ0723171.1 hypothetical protein HanOQP8_Chr08g0294961 [Helianthus annuus]KAJ0765562.1 hypothetical protein HanPI659440_Chr08g0304911 [Helianthus annuus]